MSEELARASENDNPPKTKYELTITVYGNSHEELMSEVSDITKGSYLILSDYYKRDEMDTHSGRNSMRLEHTNPEQTPEKYKEELDAWWGRGKANKPTTVKE